MVEANRQTSYTRTSAALGGQYRKFFGASVAAALLLQVTIVTDTIIVGQLLGPVVNEAVGAVDAFAGNREQFDDLTLLSLMRTPDPVELPVDIASFSVVRENIMTTSCDDDLKLKACLACEEAFVNVVSYSKANHLWFAVMGNGTALRIALADDGDPFDPTSTVVAEKDFEELDCGGMGIGLVRQLASGLQYHRENNRNVLVIYVAAE